jgi:hypothetical protein
MVDSEPDQNPPSTGIEASTEEAKPSMLPEQETSMQTEVEPSEDFGQPETEETAMGETGWNNSKKVSGLWSINQDKNSWAAISGMGWKKLANNSNSAVIALTILASHALQTGHIINFREENGQIKEIYAW